MACSLLPGPIVRARRLWRPAETPPADSSGMTTRRGPLDAAGDPDPNGEAGARRFGPRLGAIVPRTYVPHTTGRATSGQLHIGERRADPCRRSHTARFGGFGRRTHR